MILVVAEQRQGVLNRASWETIAAAQQAGGPIRIAVLGQGVAPLAGELAAAAVEGVVAVDTPALAEYTADGYVAALAALIDEINRSRTDHIITIEDPIEFLHRHKRCVVNQREVGTDATSFSDALRATTSSSRRPSRRRLRARPRS